MTKNLKIILIIFLALTLILLTALLVKQKQSSKQSQIIKQSNNMFILSSAFLDGNQIPDKYGCHGQNINPPLEFSGVPQEAKSLVLIVNDPDAPSGDWTHWLVFNINPQIKNIAENSTPAGAVISLNNFGDKSYGGPCPPFGTHHYQFKLYALDTVLNLSSSAQKADILQAIEGHAIDQSVLVGTYSR